MAERKEAGMSEHTPGPWQARGNAVYAGHRCVATTEGFRIKTRNADTRLIAAAPTMLAELEEILEFAVSERSPLREQEIASIRDVIAKARGELSDA